EIMDQMKNLGGSGDCSFSDFLDSLPDDEETRAARSVAIMYVQGFHAARVERIGVRSLNQVNEAAESIDGDKTFRILSGYDGLVQHLLKQAEQRQAIVHLNTIVREVRWRRNHAEVIGESQGKAEQFRASRVLVTLPLGVLQAASDQLGAVQFVPLLPPDHQEAIKCLAMGQVVKINLRFCNRFWEDLELPFEGGREKLSDLGFIHCSEAVVPTWWTVLPVRAPIIVGWVGGPDAEELLTHNEDFILNQAIASLASVLGVSRTQVREQ